MSTVSTRTRTFVHFVQQHPVVQAATETLRKLTSGRRDEVPFCSCSCLSKGHSLIFSLSSPPAGVRKPTEFCALGPKGMLRQGGASLRQGHNEKVCLRCGFILHNWICLWMAACNEVGLAYNLGRVSIGSCDFGLGNWTDVEDLTCVGFRKADGSF